MVKINPTFPNNTNEEISTLFLQTLARMNYKYTSPSFDNDYSSFSLFDYLGIDEVKMTGKILKSITKKVDKEGNESYHITIDYVCNNFNEAVSMVKKIGVEE